MNRPVSVFFKDILGAVKLNKNLDYVLPVCRIQQNQVISDTFRNVSAPRVQIQSNCMQIRPVKAVAVVKPAINQLMIVDEEEAPTPPPPSPTPPPPSPSLAATVIKPTVPAPVADPINKKHTRGIDPLCIGIESRDPIYAVASAAVKQSIESEEARILEAAIDEIYKAESGRSRGWTKTALQKYLMGRAATGSDTKSFDWSTLWTDKMTSALLDFICLAKRIRLFVWRSETHEVGLWPAADPTVGQTPVVTYHISAAGSILDSPPIDPMTLKHDRNWTLLAPFSVEHSLEKLTLAELDTVATSLGVSGLIGKKAERIRKIASARMQMRIAC